MEPFRTLYRDGPVAWGVALVLGFIVFGLVMDNVRRGPPCHYLHKFVEEQMMDLLEEMTGRNWFQLVKEDTAAGRAARTLRMARRAVRDVCGSP